MGGLYGMVAEAATRGLLRVVVGPSEVGGSPPDTSKIYDVLPWAGVKITGKPDAAMTPNAGGSAVSRKLVAAAGRGASARRAYQVEIKNHAYNGEAPSHSEVVQACLYGDAARAPAVLAIDRGGLIGGGVDTCTEVTKAPSFERCGPVVWPLANAAGTGGAGICMHMFVFPLAYSEHVLQVRAVT